MNEIKLPASKIMDIQSTVSCQIDTVGTSSSVFDEDFFGEPMRIKGTDYQYIPFGVDDQLPYNILELIGRDEIMSQNMQFNTQTCYACNIWIAKPTNRRKNRILGDFYNVILSSLSLWNR